MRNPAGLSEQDWRNAMRLGNKRRPGTLTAFIDSVSGDAVLAVRCNEAGETAVSFRLRDKHGDIVAESAGFEQFYEGLVVRDCEGEVLLELPSNAEGVIAYRLYNQRGKLMTQSDGVRTEIFGYLHMESASTSQGTAWLRAGGRSTSSK
jgi:hypothetical protein